MFKAVDQQCLLQLKIHYATLMFYDFTTLELLVINLINYLINLVTLKAMISCYVFV